MTETSQRYWNSLDGVRAIAAVLVLVEHSFQDFAFIQWVTPGYFGVRVFFVLSGFLITGILLKMRDRLSVDESIKKRAFFVFYARRSLRIFPIYYITIVFLILISPLVNGLQGSHIWRLLYASNFHMAIHNTGDSYYGHLWTLAVEEQFYLFWPFVILLAPKRFITPIILVVIFISPVTRAFSAALELNDFWIRKPTWACFDSLGGGALLACLEKRQPPPNSSRFSTIVIPLSILCVGLVLVGLHFHFVEGENSLASSFLLGISEAPLICMLIFHLTSSESLLTRVLSASPLVWLGKRSYGFYLYHGFVMPFVSLGFRFIGFNQKTFLGSVIYFVLVLIVTVIFCAVSWRLIEKPFNSMKDRFVI